MRGRRRRAISVAARRVSVRTTTAAAASTSAIAAASESSSVPVNERYSSTGNRGKRAATMSATPNEPSDAAKVTPNAARIAGAHSGQKTKRATCHGRAPSVRAASRRPSSTAASAASIVRVARGISK